ncbi:MAG: cytochrome d ubiquinol oxidase subunit II, partial [Propionibacterium sp.]|nr:cytochrome d ubiquinol oxidase subunit II [Propionibacterium sp.]
NLMSKAALFGVPLVLAYTIWSYSVFRRRLSVANMPPEPRTVAAGVAQG